MAARDGDREAATTRDDGGGRAQQASGRHGTGLLVGGVAAALVAALVAARLSASSEQEAQQAVAVADANRLVALSASETRLDTSLLLAAQAFRLADTPETRGGLTAALDGRARVERAVSVGGVPQHALLAGGRTVTFGVGNTVVGWPVGPSTLPSVLLELPVEWGAATVVAPSAAEDLLLLAGVYRSGAPWLRTISTLDGTSRLLLEGDQVGGRPVDGAVTADGRRLLLLVAEPAGAARDAARWHLIEVGVADGIRRDTGIGGVAPVPFEWLRADFADDSASVVVWDGTVDGAATRVQLADGRQTPIAAQSRPAESFGFRALPAGAAQLWNDGAITLVDRGGSHGPGARRPPGARPGHRDRPGRDLGRDRRFRGRRLPLGRRPRDRSLVRPGATVRPYRATCWAWRWSRAAAGSSRCRRTTRSSRGT